MKRINWNEEKENLKSLLEKGYTYIQIAHVYGLNNHNSIKRNIIKLGLEQYYKPIFRCKYCDKEFDNKQQYMGHVSVCEKNPNYNNRLLQLEHARSFINLNNRSNEDCVCKFCNKQILNKGSLIAHEKTCKLNPNKVEDWRKNNLREYSKPGHIGNNQFIKSDKLGLPKPEIKEETRNKLSIISKNHFKEYWSDNNNKIKHSKIMKDAVKNHPESYSSSNVNGRVKHVNYNGIILDSSWEYEVAKSLDNNYIKWIRPKEGFEYIWNNDKHLYFPDFYLPEYDLYLEVKGYEREKDKIKYKILNNLIVLKKREINNIKQDINFIIKLIENNKK